MHHNDRSALLQKANELLELGRAISEGSDSNPDFDTGVALQLVSRALLNLHNSHGVGDKQMRLEGRENAAAFLKNASDLLKK